MKPKKKSKNINFDKDCTKFLEHLAKSSEASYFVNELVKNSDEFKTWLKKS